MNASPSISVIIPAYNAAKTITRAIDSVINQTYEVLEIVIVDDESKDETANVINSHHSKSIIKLIQVQNGGPAKARNIAIENASGEWLAFLDADDIWIDNKKLQLQVDVIKQQPDAVLIDTYAKIYWGKDRTITNKKVKKGLVFDELLKKNTINATSSVLANAKTVRAIGGFDDTLHFGEDRLLWAQLAIRGGVYTTPHVCIYKENHENNLTSKGLSNLKHRENLVEKLFQLKSITRDQRKKLWLANYKEFLVLSYKQRHFKVYSHIAKRAMKKSGIYFIFSKFFPVYIASYMLRIVYNEEN